MKRNIKKPPQSEVMVTSADVCFAVSANDRIPIRAFAESSLLVADDDITRVFRCEYQPPNLRDRGYSAGRQSPLTLVSKTQTFLPPKRAIPLDLDEYE